MIITIDGPAGSGKSSAAQCLARRLGFEVLDTGAMYRAVALAVLNDGIDVADAPTLAGLLGLVHIEVHSDRVLLDGQDVTHRIRTPEVSAASSRLAALPAVRRSLAAQQRTLGQGRNLVCEGRDQGTAVFPDADCKFFLQADRGERARRRWKELHARGATIALGEVLSSQDERDERDSSRDLAPMIPAADAIVIDTTNLTLEQVVDRMEQEVRRCLPA